MNEEEQHILAFPRDRSVGWVKVPCAGPDPLNKWDLVGLAVGDVAVPSGIPVRLVVEPSAARDLSWLQVLLPGDLTELYLVQTDVTDAELRHVARLTELEVLTLAHTYANITDAGLAAIRPLRQLRRLSLNATDVSDVGLSYLRDFTQMEALTLGATHVTDGGLCHLYNLRRLLSLSFDTAYSGRRSLVTDAGISALKNVLPNCVVVGAIDP